MHILWVSAICEEAGENFFISSSDANDAAWLCDFINDWWDSMDKEMALHNTNFELWHKFRQVMQNLHFVMKRKVEKSEPRTYTVEEIKSSSAPTPCNMILTVTNYELLLQHLAARGFTTLKGKHVNQDSLENLHGLLRAIGCANTVPNNQQYEGALKTATINGTFGVKIKGTNCESTRNVEPYFSLERMLNFAENKLTYLAEVDALPNESQAVEIGTVGGSFRAETVRKEVVSSCKDCHACLNDNRFIGAFDNLERNLLASIHTSYKKFSIQEDLCAIAVKMLTLSWNECQLHRLDLPDRVSNVAVKNFLLSWCRKQNDERRKKHLPAFLITTPSELNLDDSSESNQAQPVLLKKLSKIMQTKGKQNKARNSMLSTPAVSELRIIFLSSPHTLSINCKVEPTTVFSQSHK